MKEVCYEPCTPRAVSHLSVSEEGAVAVFNNDGIPQDKLHCAQYTSSIDSSIIDALLHISSSRLHQHAFHLAFLPSSQTIIKDIRTPPTPSFRSLRAVSYIGSRQM